MIPNIKELKLILENQPNIQFAAILKGKYDLLIYYLDSDFTYTEENIWNLRNSTILNKYRAKWYITPFRPVFSFIPIRDIFIDKILKKRVWSRTKQQNEIKQDNLMKRELLLLRTLNSEGSASFSKIDKMNNFSKGTSRYTYYRLKEKKIIKRITITMAIPIKYVGFIIEEILDAEKASLTADLLYQNIFQYGEYCNKYSLVGIQGSPQGNIYFLPITKDGELETTKTALKNINRDSNYDSFIIENILVGTLCYRRFDSEYSRQYGKYSVSKKSKDKKLKVIYDPDEKDMDYEYPIYL